MRIPLTAEELQQIIAAEVATACANLRERIAASLEGVEEFCKDYTLETGEVLIPRDVAAQVARLGGVPELLEES